MAKIHGKRHHKESGETMVTPMKFHELIGYQQLPYFEDDHNYPFPRRIILGIRCVTFLGCMVCEKGIFHHFTKSYLSFRG